MVETSREPQSTSDVLDRTVDLSGPGFGAIALGVALCAGLGFRFVQLDLWSLGADEAKRAYDAWLLYRGQPSMPGQPLSQISPLFLILQSFGFFLFGVTDGVARLLTALAGLAIVALTPLLSPLVGRAGVLGMACLTAISPTLIYASRTATPESLIGGLAVLLIVALVRMGIENATERAIRRWAVVAGMSLGALLAAGPSAISVLISVGAGIGVALTIAGDHPIRRGFVAIRQTPGALPIAVVGGVTSLIVLFTRLFSDPMAIAGLGQTFGDWIKLLATTSSDTPTQLFLLALFLYEPLVVITGIVAAVGGRARAEHRAGWALIGGWFVAALLIWSFSAGRTAQHAIHVALPLILLGGAVLGETLAGLHWPDFWRGVGGGLALALLGLVVGLSAVGSLLTNPRPGATGMVAALPAVIIVTLVVIPLSYTVFALIGAELEKGRGDQPPRLALLVVAVLLGLFTFRSAILLNFFRADEGTELLAQRTATAAVKPAVTRIVRLARDQSVTDGSVRDLAGGHGLAIAVEREVRWPLQWYFREFPNLSIVDDGQAARSPADVVIAATDVGMAEDGYTARLYPWLNRVPPAYASPNIGTILAAIFAPEHWGGDLRFLLYRDGIVPGDPEPIAIGLNRELADRLFPSSGPYTLYDRRGAGAARGQFSDPLGIAVADGGTIYVVDQGNTRIQRFDANGGFIDIWGGSGDALDLARPTAGLGPTAITIGPDGLLYVADTWNHRVLVLKPNGEQVRTIGGGERGAEGGTIPADTGDDPTTVQTKPGGFFGPRAMAVTADEIFVTDTGNERIQVFGLDGTFKRTWGGFGSEPDQLIEPVGLAIGPDGLVYVADSGNRRISVFTPAGIPVAQLPADFWPAKDPKQLRPAFQPYLVFDQAGNLYVTSSGTASVVVLTRAGQIIDTIREVGGDPLRRPVGIAIAPNGDVLISDLDRDAVYRYVPPPAPPIAPAGSPSAATPIGEDARGLAPTVPASERG